MSTLETFRADVRSKRGRLREVSEATGLKQQTLRNWLYGHRRDPRSSLLDILRKFYEAA